MTLETTERWKGQGAILLCAFLWSSSGLFIKLVNWNPLTIAGLRSLVAAALMLLLRVLFPPRTVFPTRKGPLWAGAISYALSMICFVAANKLTASANAILLQYSAPIWTGLLGWAILHEKPRREHWLALLATVAGFLLFFRDGLASGRLLGDGLAVLAGLLFGAHPVFLRMQKEGNPTDSLLLAHTLCFVLMIPFIAVYPPAPAAPPVLAVFFMGSVQVGTAILFSIGIKRVNALQVMLTAMIEPVLNPVWVLLATGERPSLTAVLGGGIIVSSVAFASLGGRTRRTLTRTPGRAPRPGRFRPHGRLHPPDEMAR